MVAIYSNAKEIRCLVYIRYLWGIYKHPYHFDLYLYTFRSLCQYIYKRSHILDKEHLFDNLIFCRSSGLPSLVDYAFRTLALIVQRHTTSRTTVYTLNRCIYCMWHAANGQVSNVSPIFFHGTPIKCLQLFTWTFLEHCFRQEEGL
jgi:hypothetical protein